MNFKLNIHAENPGYRPNVTRKQCRVQKKNVSKSKDVVDGEIKDLSRDQIGRYGRN